MRLLVIALLTISLPAVAQYKMQTPAGEAPGPWLFGTIGVGKASDGKALTTALKGLALKLGANGEAGICYDLNLCRVAGAWTGGKFVTPMNLMSRGEYPSSLGETLFVTEEEAGFEGAAFKGFYMHNGRGILKWDLHGTEVLETPEYQREGGVSRLSRHFDIAPSEHALRLAVGPPPPAAGKVQRIVVASSPPTRPTDAAGWLTVPPHPDRLVLSVDVLIGLDAEEVESVKTRIEINHRQSSIAQDTHGGAALWPEPVVTRGELGRDLGAYVVDSVKVPDPNPWGAPMFIGGFDFFGDGRAAVCTFHGDVFIVSGLDENLEKVTWRRFASGLYHPLGLKVVENEIYVTERSGITRLRDLNGDGEADLYEPFNWDVTITKSFHEFTFDLQTDADGNFYFAKAGPVKNGGRGFDEIAAHHGTLMRVSPDGRKLDVVASGFRAPNGIGVGPRGELTSGDNEGTWTPACKINWIKPGGFYGVVDLAHRQPPPTDYDRPLCWLPKRVDNSGGGQVWVPNDDRWGPWRGQLLHLSYGHCALFGVLKERYGKMDIRTDSNTFWDDDYSGSLLQGGVVRFPLKFESGIMRARFNPLDGQLYVAGLRGWQTDGTKNGCFQRVRYTGAPVQMPIELHARKNGLELKFTCSLDTQSAADPENWNVEVWNYLWSSAYGSPEISTIASAEKPAEAGKDGIAQYTKAQMSASNHDTLAVTGVSIGTDDRTVFLEIPGIKPVMQMSIRYGIKSADGAEMKGEIVNTIHALAD